MPARQIVLARCKAGKAIESAGVSDELRKQLEDVADTQIKAKGRICARRRC